MHCLRLPTIDTCMTDKAGNLTDGDTPQTKIDISAPTATSIIAAISEDTGTPGDFITTDKTLLIFGNWTGTLGSDERIQVRIDKGTNWGQWVDVTSYDASIKTWIFDNENEILADGNYTLYSRVVDEAGKMRCNFHRNNW